MDIPSPFERLPSELLVDIFGLLTQHEIIKVALVCKRFNNVLSATPRLLERLKVQFNINKIGDAWIGTRDCSCVFIDGSAAIFFLNIFERMGASVTDLYINGNGVEMSVLKRVLELMPNVTTLSIGCDADEVTAQPADLLKPISARNFRIFEYSGTNENFRVFANCTARVLKLTKDFTVKSANDDAFKTFIKAQKELKILHLGNFVAESSLFTDRTLNEVEFKLEGMRFYQFDAFELPNFACFVENFRDTLTFFEMEICESALLEHFIDFKNLRTVSLVKIFYLYLERPMTHVEELIVDNVKVGLGEHFPNVSRISIIDYLKKPSQVKNFKKLEDLEIGDIDVAELKVPKVKRLQLSGTRFLCAHPFRFEGNHVEELTIEGCGQLNWLETFLERKETKLKLLKLSDVFVKEKLEKAIKRNAAKIEKIVMIECEMEVKKLRILPRES